MEGLDTRSPPDRVDLAESFRHPLFHAHRGELLHRLDGRELALDRHAGLAATDLIDGDARGRHRELCVRRAVVVREAVAEDEQVGRLDLVHDPEPAGLIAFRAGHVVVDVAARAQVVVIDRRRVRRRSPPSLQLAGIRPKLPDALRRGIELGLQRQRARLRVLADSGDGHRCASFGASWRSWSICSTR